MWKVGSELQSMTLENDLAAVESLSCLQKMMFARYLNLSYEEQWTPHSQVFAMYGSILSSLREFV